MEGGRARLLADALERNRRDLALLPERGHADLHRRYQEISAEQERLRQPASAQPGQPEHVSGQERLAAILAADAVFEQVVAEIRQVSGYSDFLAEPTFARIQAAARPGVPLVYLLATSAGGLALVVWSEDEHKSASSEKPDVWPVTAL